jgi:single-strand DNA-binding protein
MAVVVGRLQMRDWTDRDGNKRRNAEVNVENIYFGEHKKADSAQPEPARRSVNDIAARYPNVAHFADMEDESELPF